jgi:hypothetical protein
VAFILAGSSLFVGGIRFQELDILKEVIRQAATIMEFIPDSKTVM